MDNGDIHQISKEIGELIAGLKSLRYEFSTMVTKQDAHNLSMEKEIRELTALKHKGSGILLAVSLAGGGIVALAHFVLDSLKGH